MSNNTTITKTMWKAYQLTHPDHQNLSLEEAAKETKLTLQELKYVLYSLRAREPSLFTDISGDRRRPAYKTARYGRWAEGQIKQKF